MGTDEGRSERETRAARNQAMFRAVNDRLREAEESLAELSGRYSFVCECIDLDCIEQIELTGDEYAALRASPDRFAVYPGHVYPDVERLVETHDQYQVVEKVAEGGDLARAATP